MSTATVYTLHPDGPPPTTKQQFAWLLYAREQANRAWDVLVSAPRRAAGYLSRLLPSLRSPRTLLGLARQALGQVRGLGLRGLLGGLVVAATHKSARGAVRRVCDALLRLGRTAGRLTVSAVQGTLQLFGERGQRASGWVGTASEAAQAYVASHVFVVRNWARGFLAKHTLTLAAAGRLARLALLGQLVRGRHARPARLGLQAALLADVVRISWQQLRTLLVRLWGAPTPPTTGGTTGFPASWAEHEQGHAARAAETTTAEPADEADPTVVPVNRAERRAQQRSQNRKGNRPAHAS